MTEERKKGQERVKVHVRLRPFSEEDMKTSGKDTIVDQLDTSRNTITIKKDNDKKSFNFDSVFDQSSTQKEIYNKVAKPALESVLEGYNATILAYGQTGTGKTHTMIGGTGISKGVIPRCMKAIFKVANECQTHSFSLRIGFIQLYMEVFQDLVKPNPASPILIREDTEDGVYLSGVNWVDVASVDDCLNILTIGEKNRNSAFTNMNANSSRSHAVFMAKLEKRIKHKLDEADDCIKKQENDNTMTKSTLYLVDLAGSERVSKTKVSGNRLDEAKNINLSLLALGNVIQALSDGKSRYIPFRDSKLTRILEQSLGGNSKTSMVVTIGPCPSNHQESLSSLQFASRAMKIQNIAKMNVAIDYKALCAKLQAELDKINDGQNISTIEYDKIITETNTLRAENDKLSAEKAKLEALLENMTKGSDVSIVSGSTEEFQKVKKFYRNKLDKQEQEHKKFTQEVDKVLLQQEEKMANMASRIVELENINMALSADLKKSQEELEQERTDREQRAEQMINEINELRQKYSNSRNNNDNLNEEVMRIIGNSINNCSLKSNSTSILLSSKLKSSMPRPKMIDIEKLRAKFPLSLKMLSNSPRASLNEPNSDLAEKVKKYDRIINNLEDELIEMAEKYNTECAAHRETQINSTMEIKSMRKQMVKLIKAFKRLEKKTYDEKKLLHEVLSQKNLELASYSAR